MEIKLSQEEINFITSKLGEIPSKLVYDVLKLLENKVVESQKVEEKKEE